MRKYSSLYLIIFKDNSEDYVTHGTAKILIEKLGLDLPTKIISVTDDQFNSAIEYEVRRYFL